MKKIVSDTEKKITHTLVPQERKMFLYAGHENNIASMMEILNVRHEPHIPTYGSKMLLEIHQINGVYGVRVREEATLWILYYL